MERQRNIRERRRRCNQQPEPQAASADEGAEAPTGQPLGIEMANGKPGDDTGNRA